MKVEEGIGEEERERRGKKKGSAIRAKISKKRSCGRRAAMRRVQADSMAIQRLFVACKSVFKGPGTVPAPADVDMLQKLLDGMRPEDLRLSMDMDFFNAKKATKGTPIIRYTTIKRCENFSMVIFFLPPKAVIPLHNHPGMTVFSKLLLGEMHIKSYDWVDPAESNDSKTPSDQLRLAKLVVDSDFSAPCNTSILYPTTGGNLHTFRAIKACAVLDVLGPPYSVEDDRDCTYYNDQNFFSYLNGAATQDGEENERIGWLEKIDGMPEESYMEWAEYLGPQIIDV